MSNPVFTSSRAFQDPVQQRGNQAQGYDYGTAASAATLENMYAQPSATPVQTNRLTYDDVIVKTGGLLALVVIAAAVSWQLSPAMPGLYIAGAIIGFVLALINIFKKSPSPALIMGYAVAEGVFLGGLSVFMDAFYPGVAMQALIATVVTFAVVLVGFKSGKLRTSPKLTKMFFIAMISYAAFSLVNLGIMLFGASDNAWGLRGGEIAGFPLGVIIGAVAVLLASYSLVMDFEQIKHGVEVGVPRNLAWTFAFGLVVTLVWLYVEFLRIFAILSGRD
ncbi:Bax inhibitor-1/YccA family protein [Flavimobilis sp. GY10621]|uniref:Bax inhibitor-1/YccA family protein n=1 Tax=Flavimobilis rhizosphaerae TaxID=2775421 RepID=A0ABR9DMA3_9MICO|nr:Bax inhibitor-1/YccA family protein [Flavimobilis rhizosphaerae]MBD9698267.1 Bax inhibitor-1/YccA family protein [Flavimobilis rhizosphaerae]